MKPHASPSQVNIYTSFRRQCGGVLGLNNDPENLKSLTLSSLDFHLKNGIEIVIEYYFYIISIVMENSISLRNCEA